MYDVHAVEKKWREAWKRDNLYQWNPEAPGKKFYLLTMFPYPSGDLHIGHWYALTPVDALARYLRMRGYNVFVPFGFDAFGLPAENAAIQRNIHPGDWTFACIRRMKEQMEPMGASFAFDHEVITCTPEYYKWNQWFFLQFYKKGLAYRKYAAVDWCPTCNTTLAREQVVGEDRRCERCDTPVIKRDLEQWFFRITAYADELLDFSQLDWPERVITMQRNWIGRSEGAKVRFPIEGHGGETIEVFTTRLDTLYGVSFLVLAPEHPLVDHLTDHEHMAEVKRYQEKTLRESEVQRLSTEKVRDGVFTGAYALHPLTGKRLPIWIADYVLMTYGTGAVMGVPGHDQRDHDFALRQGLEIPIVIASTDGHVPDPSQGAFTEDGILINSGPYTGMTSAQAREAIRKDLEEKGLGEASVQYRLRDWLISRQRYWGTPIPIVYCDRCGTVPVPEEDLPVLLPDDVNFLPTGESPLKFHEGFLHTTCPRCGGPARRETDTMDTFVDSSWYWYRYLSPHLEEAPFDQELAKRWTPPDLYTGGVEHAVMHLLYARFFTKVLRDLGLVDHDEPFPRLFNQGIVLGPDGRRMSKSRGNVINPDELVAQYGADVVRGYLMFMRPWDQGGPWQYGGIEGVQNFLQRFWRAVVGDEADPQPPQGEASPEKELELRRLVHRTIRKVTDDMEKMQFNTALAAQMELARALFHARYDGLYGTEAWKEATRTACLLLAPFCPYMAEEAWHQLGETGSVHLQQWPEADASLLEEELITVVIQINGRVRDRIQVPKNLSQEELEKIAREHPKVKEAFNGKGPRKVIVVPDRLINFVI
ncbi:MAG: leucine--tRNA ligase [Clostridiales bacterium]|nr:leucine--tRNA ligase [Clostridiales bacterium]